MKARLKSIIFTLIMLGIGFYFLRTIPLLKLLGIEKDITFVYKELKDPYLCSLKKYKTTKIGNKSVQIENKNLKVWDLKINDIEKATENTAFLITSSEDPYRIGTMALMATDCLVLDKNSIEKYKEKIKNNKLDSLKIYLYNKENFQIELKNGFLLDEKMLINLDESGNQ